MSDHAARFNMRDFSSALVDLGEAVAQQALSCI